MTKENRIRLRKSVNDALDYYVAERNALLEPSGEELTKGTLVSNVMKKFLIEVGHYPPKYTKAGMERLAKDLDKIDKEGEFVSQDEAKKILWPKEVDQK